MFLFVSSLILGFATTPVMGAIGFNLAWSDTTEVWGSQRCVSFTRNSEYYVSPNEPNYDIYFISNGTIKSSTNSNLVYADKTDTYLVVSSRTTNGLIYFTGHDGGTDMDLYKYWVGNDTQDKINDVVFGEGQDYLIDITYTDDYIIFSGCNTNNQQTLVFDNSGSDILI
jgi:hypothetical protein